MYQSEGSHRIHESGCRASVRRTGCTVKLVHSIVIRATIMPNRTNSDTLRNTRFGKNAIKAPITAKHPKKTKALATKTEVMWTPTNANNSGKVPFSESTTPGNRIAETAFTSKAKTDASTTIAARFAKKIVRARKGSGARFV